VRPALVTGASGFLGWHVARVLIERGYRVRGLARRAGSIADPEIEEIHGDLRDADSLRRAVQGCELVFHAAADYRFFVPNPGQMRETNVIGTAAVMQAALEAGVPRIVHVSSVATLNLTFR